MKEVGQSIIKKTISLMDSYDRQMEAIKIEEQRNTRRLTIRIGLAFVIAAVVFSIIYIIVL